MNGRVANNGDSVVLLSPYNKRPIAGILYNAVAGNDACNGMLAPFTGGAHLCPNLKECVHLDDFVAALPESYADTSAKPAVSDAP